jgi:hypothetical protein
VGSSFGLPNIGDEDLGDVTVSVHVKYAPSAGNFPGIDWNSFFNAIGNFFGEVFGTINKNSGTSSMSTSRGTVNGPTGSISMPYSI